MKFHVGGNSIPRIFNGVINLKHRTTNPRVQYNDPSILFNSMKDKVALVNEGTYGLGLKCARELLQCGVKGLMISGADEKQGRFVINELCREHGKEKLAFIRMDSSKDVIVKHVYSETIKYFRGLDIVFNYLHHMKHTSWEEQVEHNVMGLIRITKCGLQQMNLNKCGGVIINAIVTKENDEQCPLYLGIKHFVITFSKALSAVSYDDTSVKIMTVCFDEEEVCDESNHESTQSQGHNINSIVNKGKNGSIWCCSV